MAWQATRTKEFLDRAPLRRHPLLSLTLEILNASGSVGVSAIVWLQDTPPMAGIYCGPLD